MGRKRRSGIITVLFLMLALVMSASWATTNPDGDAAKTYTLPYFKTHTNQYLSSVAALRKTIQALDSNPSSIIKARFALATCRLYYKSIEPIVEYFFENRIRIFNPAPVYEIEEPYMEFQHPVGMQLIESYLFDDDPASHKQELLAETEVLSSTAESLHSMLMDKEMTDAALLESLRLELIRITALGITGYDAPELKSGIAESAVAISAVRSLMQPFTAKYGTQGDSIRYYLNLCQDMLDKGGDNFNDFDRPQFLTTAMLPLQRLVGQMAIDLNIYLNSFDALDYRAAHIFDRKAISIRHFTTDTTYLNPQAVTLGKALFFDKRLSGNGKKACISCHAPDRYFTDGLDRSLDFDDTGHVSRNAPSILYAAYQHAQFSDARARNMQEQIGLVLASPREMHADVKTIIALIKEDKEYRKAFAKAFPNKKRDSLITLHTIAGAIAAYEQSLSIMTSRFDQFIGGEATALNDEEKQGFNLFMGKAMCGSCHFAPLFNGLLPPTYDITEFESLGMTATADLAKPTDDKDSGRFHIFPIEYYIGAFKTPTVRNAAMTAPYMHHGIFKTLEEVVEFYNKGGGKGLGLDAPHQTLSDKPLDLSEDEKKALVSFLKSLTDKPVLN